MGLSLPIVGVAVNWNGLDAAPCAVALCTGVSNTQSLRRQFP